MDLDESDNNINIINFNSDQRSDNNNANIIRNNPSENDYQFCGLISGMNRYKTISLGIKEGNFKLAFSSAVSKDSKILTSRNVIQRAKNILPELK